MIGLGVAGVAYVLFGNKANAAEVQNPTGSPVGAGVSGGGGGTFSQLLAQSLASSDSLIGDNNVSAANTLSQPFETIKGEPDPIKLQPAPDITQPPTVYVAPPRPMPIMGGSLQATNFLR